MRIAFDVHGTMDSAPEVFKPMMQMFMRSGFDVVIFSGPPKAQIADELDRLGYIKDVHYQMIYSVVDFLKSIDVPMTQDASDNWWCDEKIWWKAKGMMCEALHVDMVIDNDFRYQHDIEKHAKFIHWDERMKLKGFIK